MPDGVSPRPAFASLRDRTGAAERVSAIGFDLSKRRHGLPRTFIVCILKAAACSVDILRPLPQPARDRQRIELDALPPGRLITMTVQLAMMGPAHRNGKLIADLASQGPRLSKSQMVGVGRRSTADQAWLPGHELAMVLVAQSDGLGRHTAASNADSVCRRRELARAAADFERRSQVVPNGSRLLVVEDREPGLEARFNHLRVDVRQRVFGWQVLVRPSRGCVAGFQGRQFGEQAIAL